MTHKSMAPLKVKIFYTYLICNIHCLSLVIMLAIIVILFCFKFCQLWYLFRVNMSNGQLEIESHDLMLTYLAMFTIAQSVKLYGRN